MRALPVWTAAVVPATLAGHGIAYALAGRSLADGHHAWIAPGLEISVAVLLAVCTTMLGGALMRLHLLVHSGIERSLLALLPRLCVAQLTIFVLMERAEGTHASALACVVQLAVALCAAYLLSLFARLVADCIAGAEEAGRYLARLYAPCASFAFRQPQWCTNSLAVRVGSYRLKRPPPQS
jgi:hypothetical protein